jgi:hypothetical protein
MLFVTCKRATRTCDHFIDQFISSPYFIRFQKTPAASDLVVLQATRMANAIDDPSDPEVIGDICQFLSTLLVLQGTTAIPEDIKEKLVQKLNTWRRRYEGRFPGETSDRCYQSLKGTLYVSTTCDHIRD